MAHAKRSPGSRILRLSPRALNLKTSEPRKVPITVSRWKALGYDSIHILPATVALYLIAVNLSGYYIGEHLVKSDHDGSYDGIVLAFIQVFAKIQELLVIASLAAILLHGSLSAILSDHGLPLGLATSGFSFARISYFWSPTFLGGAIGLCQQRRLRGSLIVFFIFLSGLLAAVVGPASAVLMLPRTKKWPQFTTHVWLNGTADDFWPSTLTEKHFAPKCNAGSPGNVCVSTGLPMLATYLAYSKNDDGGFAISTPEQNYPRRIEGAPRVEDVNAEAWTFAPHAPTSLVLTNLWMDPHWNAVNSRPTGKLSGEAEAEAVAVRTVCDPTVRELSNDTQSILFPDLPAYELWSRDRTDSSNTARIELSKTLWGPDNSSSLTQNTNMTTIFIPPNTNMTSVTTGVLILGPQNRTTKRLAMACSVDARWNRALHTMVKSDDYGIGNVGNAITATLRGRRKRSELSKATLPLRNGEWRPISAEPVWLQAALGYNTLFNFGFQPHSLSKHGRESYRTTALGALIMARVKHFAEPKTPLQHWSNNTDAVESVIATAFADAISRVGIERQQLFGGFTPTESVPACQQITNRYTFCPSPSTAEMFKWTRVTFSGFSTGYALKASKATDFIAIVLLATYVLIVALYLASSALRHQRFLCWNTIEDLILLAKNSRPIEDYNNEIKDLTTSSATTDSNSRIEISQSETTKEIIEGERPHPLTNTSAGIQCLATMILHMKIKADPEPANDRQESNADEKSVLATRRVQMVFTEQEATRLEPVRPGVAYG